MSLYSRASVDTISYKGVSPFVDRINLLFGGQIMRLKKLDQNRIIDYCLSNRIIGFLFRIIIIITGKNTDPKDQQKYIFQFHFHHFASQFTILKLILGKVHLIFNKFS